MIVTYTVCLIFYIILYIHFIHLLIFVLYSKCIADAIIIVQLYAIRWETNVEILYYINIDYTGELEIILTNALDAVCNAFALI